MSLALVVVTDGRHDYLQRSLESAEKFLPDVFEHKITIDDSDHKLGFTGAVRAGFQAVGETDAEYVFWLEEDFLFRKPVRLDRMIGVLERRPHLTQMSLLRQPVNEEEKAAGGIIHAHPEQYVERTSIDTWIETDRFLFTTNPSVFSTQLCRREWPDVKHSEGVFGAQIRKERPDARCGIWGQKWDPPRVWHMGDERAGWGY